MYVVCICCIRVKLWEAECGVWEVGSGIWDVGSQWNVGCIRRMWDVEYVMWDVRNRVWEVGWKRRKWNVGFGNLEAGCKMFGLKYELLKNGQNKVWSVDAFKHPRISSPVSVFTLSWPPIKSNEWLLTSIKPILVMLMNIKKTLCDPYTLSSI